MNQKMTNISSWWKYFLFNFVRQIVFSLLSLLGLEGLENFDQKDTMIIAEIEENIGSKTIYKITTVACSAPSRPPVDRHGRPILHRLVNHK